MKREKNRLVRFIYAASSHKVSSRGFMTCPAHDTLRPETLNSEERKDSHEKNWGKSGRNQAANWSGPIRVKQAIEQGRL